MKNAVCVISVLLTLVVLLFFCCEAASAATVDPNFIATNPNPADGQTHVAVESNLTLTWDIVDVNTEGYTIEYDVYYGTDQNEVETSTTPDANGIETKNHTLSWLEHDTEYFWRIDTRETYWDPHGFPPIVTFRIIKGSVWRFRTLPEKAWDPDPADGAEYVEADPNVTLSWKLGNLDSILFLLEHVRYRVYYGTDFAEVSSRDWWPDFDVYVDTSVQIGPLTPWTTYYWRIDTGLVSTRPPHVGVTLEGDVWRFTTGPAPPRVITVDDDGAADFNNIQAAIDDANEGDEVHVRPGTYYEAITMKDGVDLIGAGANVTIIDAGSYSEIYGVVRAENIQDASTTLRGFTLTNGPHGVSAKNSKIIIERNIIRNNGGQSGSIIYGAGIIDSNSIAAIRHNTISDNVEMGIWITKRYGAPELEPSTIVNNVVANNDKGIVGLSYSSAIIRNNTIDNNGAGICSYVGSSLLIVNNIVTSNRVGITKDNTSSTATSLYNDVWNNTEDNYRYVSPGLGDISENPLFMGNGDYHLKSQAGRCDANEGGWTTDDVTSPCIDAGNPMTPIALDPFPNGGIINMGAYGGTAEASKSYFGKPACETIMAGDINGDCEINFEDFRLMALHWCEDNNP